MLEEAFSIRVMPPHPSWSGFKGKAFERDAADLYSEALNEIHNLFSEAVIRDFVHQLVQFASHTFFLEFHVFMLDGSHQRPTVSSMGATAPHSPAISLAHPYSG